jgi:hypothetical protein
LRGRQAGIGWRMPQRRPLQIAHFVVAVIEKR